MTPPENLNPVPPNTPSDPSEPPDPRWAILLAGAFGGVLTPLLRIGLAYTQQTKDRPVVDFNYWLGALLLAALGAGVALAFKEARTQKAVILGLSLPAFLQVAISDVQRNAAKQASLNFSIPFVASAFAQEPSATAQSVSLSPARSIELSTGQSAHNYSATVFDATGKERATFNIQGDKFVSLPLPDDATSIQFSAGGTGSPKYPLSTETGAATAFEVTVDRTKTLSLLQALGADAKYKTTISATRNVILPPLSGAEGWVYLGKRKGASWETLYMSLPNQEVPEPGTPASVTFTLKLRSDAGTQYQSKGTLPTGTKLKVLDTKTSDGITYWAKVKTGE
jgi:hypothetical protein